MKTGRAKEPWNRRKKGRGRDLEKVKMEMTPMIDVCFQLLIFFMVTSKFKTLEGKLAAFLPKDRGMHDINVPPPERLPVRIVLRWNPTIRKCKVYVGERLCNYDEQGVARARTLVRQILQTGVKEAEIDAGGDVPMRWVVQAMNMLIQTEVKSIQFTGAMDPLQDNR